MPTLLYNTRLHHHKREERWNALFIVAEQILTRIYAVVERMSVSQPYENVLGRLEVLKQIIPAHTVDMLSIIRQARTQGNDMMSMGRLFRLLGVYVRHWNHSFVQLTLGTEEPVILSTSPHKIDNALSAGIPIKLEIGGEASAPSQDLTLPPRGEFVYV